MIAIHPSPVGGTPPAAATPTPTRKRTGGRRVWPWIILGLLLAHTAAMIVFVTIANRDASFSVDPDYYGKAVRWDQDQAIRRASDLLDWNVQIRPAEAASLPVAPNQRLFVLTLQDGEGHPIPASAVDVNYFHDAHGREIRSEVLTADPADPKRFKAALTMPYAGLWEFELTVHAAGGQKFFKKFTAEVK
jgi:hypothetical protein